MRKKKKRPVCETVLVVCMLIVTAFLCSACVQGGDNAQAEQESFSVRSTITLYPVEGGIFEGSTQEEQAALMDLGDNSAIFPLPLRGLCGEYVTYLEKSITVKDLAQLTENVRYVADDVNGVVVSKWLYYYSALSYYTGYTECARNDTPIRYCDPDERVTSANKDPRCFMWEGLPTADTLTNLTFYLYPGGTVPYSQGEVVLRDGYTAEHVVMDVGALRCIDGKSLRDMTQEELESVDDARVVSSINADEFIATHPEEVVAAAYAKYGAFDASGEPIHEGFLQIGGKWVRVIGYYETETDKLLSTGVTMDRDSQEYRALIEQLTNRVAYSNFGNFLAE